MINPALTAKLVRAMSKQILKSLIIGVERRWWDGSRSGMAAVGLAWTLTEVINAALPATKVYLEAHGPQYLWLMVVLFVAVFFLYAKEPSLVTFTVPTTGTKITLKYGDLFAEPANLLIGVNEFFDGELGAPVAKNSVHGQLIVRNFGGSAGKFRAAVDSALARTSAAPTPTGRPSVPNAAYPMGTTAVIASGQYSVFLMAMARSDFATFKASSDVPTLWQALKGGLQAVHDHGNGDALAMPLFGNGQAGINLKPQHLLRLLTLALVDFGRNSNSKLPNRVIVVLHPSCFEDLDLREIARDWKKS